MAKFQCDGHIGEILECHIEKGTVLRSIESDGGQSSFSDCVILDVFYRDGRGMRVPSNDSPYKYRDPVAYVKLARPYAFVSGAGTCCPSVLTGVEEVEISVEKLLLKSSRYRVVLQSTGLAAQHTT